MCHSGYGRPINMRLGGEVTLSLTVVARAEERTFQTGGNTQVQRRQRGPELEVLSEQQGNIHRGARRLLGSTYEKGLQGRQEPARARPWKSPSVSDVMGTAKGLGRGNLCG